MAYLQDIILRFDNKPGLHVAVYGTGILPFDSEVDVTDVVTLTVINYENMLLKLPTWLPWFTLLQYLYVRQSRSMVSSLFVGDRSEKVINFFRTSTTYSTQLELLSEAGIGHHCLNILNNHAYPFCHNLESVVLAVPGIDPACMQQVLAWCDLTLRMLLFHPTGIFI